MKILLRPWLAKDLEPLVALANNKKIFDTVRDAFPHPYTLKNAKEWLSLNVGITPVLNFVIEVDGNFAGSIGMVPKTDIVRGNMEIGYWLGEAYWNKGIVTTAVNLIVEYGFKQLGIIRIHTGVFEYNSASMRVLEKCGFTKEGVFRKSVFKQNKIWDEIRYSKINPQFESQQA